eukprot:11357936-Alexandrium_andersonii.AAC.1
MGIPLVWAQGCHPSPGGVQVGSPRQVPLINPNCVQRGACLPFGASLRQRPPGSEPSCFWTLT